MDIKEIKERYSEAILEELTTKDGSGRGYICPICGSGSGPNGTGLVPVPGKPGYYKCFAIGCEFYGDILELVGQTFHLPDTAQQIEKAGQLVHVDFKEGKNTWADRPKIKDSDWDDDKNPTETSNNITEEEYKKALAETGDFVEKAAAALLGSETAKKYLEKRGISLQLAEKYRLGYVPSYRDGMNTPALIIPTGPTSYTARSITTDDAKRKCRKKAQGGKAGIFGISCLDDKPPITFVVEGELDALSIMEAGYPAIATGGGTSKKEIAEAIKQRVGMTSTTFFIIPDNDRLPDGSPDLAKGMKAGQDLRTTLKAAGLNAAIIDVLGESWPQQCKDCNDFLVWNGEDFKDFLRQKQLALEERMLGRVSGYMQDFVAQIAANTPPIPTRLFSLDVLLEGGLHPGLITIGAISSLGKTTFCLNMADEMAATGQDVVIYSLEMSRFELISKIISRRTALAGLLTGDMKNAKTNLGVSDYNRWGRYSREEKELLHKCMDDFSLKAAQHLYIREGMATIGTEAIRQELNQHIFMTGRKPVVFVDYVQILKTPDVRLTDKQKTDENVVELKRISRDLDIPVICVSSFNRDNYTEPVTMRAYKESGAIEYTNDVLIGLQYAGMDYRDGEKDKDRIIRIRSIFKENEAAARKGKSIPIECKVLKNRSGAKGSCTFNYFPMFNLYTEEITETEESPW